MRGMVGNVIWERLASHAISHGRREVDSISSWARSMDFEKELLDAFDRIVYEDFLPILSASPVPDARSC